MFARGFASTLSCTKQGTCVRSLSCSLFSSSALKCVAIFRARCSLLVSSEGAEIDADQGTDVIEVQSSSSADPSSRATAAKWVVKHDLIGNPMKMVAVPTHFFKASLGCCGPNLFCTSNTRKHILCLRRSICFSDRRFDDELWFMGGHEHALVTLDLLPQVRADSCG